MRNAINITRPPYRKYRKIRFKERKPKGIRRYSADGHPSKFQWAFQFAHTSENDVPAIPRRCSSDAISQNRKIRSQGRPTAVSSALRTKVSVKGKETHVRITGATTTSKRTIIERRGIVQSSTQQAGGEINYETNRARLSVSRPHYD